MTHGLPPYTVIFKTKKMNLKAILEEGIYETYKKTHPVLVDGIKVLLLKGETPNKIKQHVLATIGKGVTENHMGYLIDYLYKKQNN